MELKKGDSVAIEGGSNTLPNGLLHLLVQARTHWDIAKSANKETVALFTKKVDGKKADKARERGVPVIPDDEAREAIGPPLEGYRRRLEEYVDNRASYYKNNVFKMGDPVSPEVMEKIEERVGFQLPEAARNLFSQLDGLQWFWTIDKEIDTGGSLDWKQTGDSSSEFWQQIKKAEFQYGGMGLTCIPDVETIFFQKWYLGADPDTAEGTVKLGRRKVDAKSFYQNLFGFDFFDSYYPCGLWADQETEDFYIVYGDDHGAAWETAPVSFEGYMEALIVRNAGERLMKSGGTKYPHLPYPVLNIIDRWSS